MTMSDTTRARCRSWILTSEFDLHRATSRTGSIGSVGTTSSACSSAAAVTAEALAAYNAGLRNLHAAIPKGGDNNWLD